MAKVRRASFKCGKCGRTFPMAMHLGRHMATMHPAKPKRAKRRRSRMVPKAPANAWGAGAPDQLLDDVRGWRDSLAAQRAACDAQIAALSQLMTALGSPVVKSTTRPSARRGRRIRRTVQVGSLRAYIQQVMRDHRGPLAAKDVAAAVRKAGYKSRNKELAKSIGKMLRAMPNVARVGRGMFRMK